MKTDKQTNPVSDGIMAWNPTCPVQKPSLNMKPYRTRREKPRKLTARESEMKRQYTRIVKWPGSWSVRLQVGNQSFTVNDSFDTKHEADWTRAMLAIALARVGK